MVRVFVFARPSDEWVTAESKGRADSMRDLVRALSRRRSFAVVADRADADVVVEITGRMVTDTETQIASFNRYGGVVKPLKGRSVAATVTVGQHTFNFVGTTSSRYWRRAAIDLAADLTEWLNDNRERIVRERR
jgi:hypothetical protein